MTRSLRCIQLIIVAAVGTMLLASCDEGGSEAMSPHAVLDAARKGDRHRGDFLLGRAVHVLADMACPPHAHFVAHPLTDPFEVHVDATKVQARSRRAVPAFLEGPPLPSRSEKSAKLA